MYIFIKPILSLLLIWELMVPAQKELHIYVTPQANIEIADGTREKPAATINQAVDFARKHIKTNGYPKKGITIWVGDGNYQLEETIEIDSILSGSPEAPFVIRAEEGATPVINGASMTSSTAFSAVKNPSILSRFINPEAREKVLVTDLKAQGITDYGQLERHGFPMFDVAAPMELVFNDEYMTLAQWPNDKKLQFDEVIDPGSSSRYNQVSDKNPIFSYSYDRPAQWASYDDIWLSGIFHQSWSPDFIKIDNIDLEKKQITLTDDHYYGLVKHEYHDNFQVSTRIAPETLAKIFKENSLPETLELKHVIPDFQPIPFDKIGLYEIDN